MAALLALVLVLIPMSLASGQGHHRASSWTSTTSSASPLQDDAANEPTVHGVDGDAPRGSDLPAAITASTPLQSEGGQNTDTSGANGAGVPDDHPGGGSGHDADHHQHLDLLAMTLRPQSMPMVLSAAALDSGRVAARSLARSVLPHPD